MTENDGQTGLRALSALFDQVSRHLTILEHAGAGEGDSGGNNAFAGPNGMTIKHLAHSIKDGRLVTFYPPEMDEVTGFVTGWDDLTQPRARVFVVTFPGEGKPAIRRLVPLDGTTILLHEEPCAPKEGDEYFNDYERIVRPFKTYVLNNVFSNRRTSQRKLAG